MHGTDAHSHIFSISELKTRLGEQAIGEIVNTRDRGLFEGYYNNEEANAARVRDGMFWTGDLGYVDADGFFALLGVSTALLTGLVLLLSMRLRASDQYHSPELGENALVGTIGVGVLAGFGVWVGVGGNGVQVAVGHQLR